MAMKGMKVKDVPAQLKPMLSMEYVKNTIKRGMDNYHDKCIQISSIQPLDHVCLGGMIFSYFVALPEERRHLDHLQHVKERGGHGFSSFLPNQSFTDNTWGGRFDMPKEMAHSHMGMATDGRYIYVVTDQYGLQCRGPTARTFVLNTETRQ